MTTAPGLRLEKGTGGSCTVAEETRECTSKLVYISGNRWVQEVPNSGRRRVLSVMKRPMTDRLLHKVRKGSGRSFATPSCQRLNIISSHITRS